MVGQKTEFNNNHDLIRYAGLATQMLLSLGVGVFAGYKADRWLAIGFPFLVWFIPLIILGAIIFSIVKSTSKK